MVLNKVYRTNASVISLLQRASDLINFYAALMIVCYSNHYALDVDMTFALLISIIIFQMIGGITDFYRSWRGMPFFVEAISLLKNWTLTFVFMVAMLFLLDKVNIFNENVSFLIEWYLLLSFTIILSRLIIRKLVIKLRTLGYNTRNVVIVGLTSPGLILAETLKETPWLGLNFKGFYVTSETDNIMNSGAKIDDQISYKILPSQILGNIDTMISDARAGRIDKVYITLPMSAENEIRKIINQLLDTTCSVLFVPDLFSLEIIRNKTEEVNGIPVLTLCETPITGLNMLIKRFEDILISSIILIFISPVLLSIAIAIKLTSPGPIIFKQIRYGMDGKPIYVWKFRSMNVMENGNIVKQAKQNDDRFTPIGGFLRRTSLDELPQFINALMGDMSIVGPRPHAVAHNEEYRKIIKGYMLRHKVKPGITGWAQINGWRGETDTHEKMEKRIQYDLEYIRNWSIWLDCRIILLTAFKGFINKSAY